MSEVIRTLVQIRDAYVKRISEYVEEHKDNLLAQASGQATWDLNSDKLFKAGEELRQITVILSCLPQESEPKQVIYQVPPVTFGLFVEQIRTNDFHRAMVSLTCLLLIDEMRAARCVNHFVVMVQSNPSIFDQIDKLKYELVNGSPSACTNLLFECFGLEHNEGIQIATIIQSRIRGKSC